MFLVVTLKELLRRLPYRMMRFPTHPTNSRYATAAFQQLHVLYDIVDFVFFSYARLERVIFSGWQKHSSDLDRVHVWKILAEKLTSLSLLS